jgi:hypothetical protein
MYIANHLRKVPVWARTIGRRAASRKDYCSMIGALLKHSACPEHHSWRWRVINEPRIVA